MSDERNLHALTHAAPVVIFRSPVTDLAGLDRLLDQSGGRWRDVELGMGDAANRELFQALKAMTGHPTLPQVFIDGEFAGGIESARSRLSGPSAPDARPARLPATALLAGYGGLIPFAGLAAWLWLHTPAAAGHVLAVYAAVILSFVGAVHWGWALGGHAGRQRYAWSVVPALAGWIGASLPPGIALPLLAASLAFVWYQERRGFADGLSAGYLRLRTHLTAGAVVALAAAWVALLVRA